MSALLNYTHIDRPSVRDGGGSVRIEVDVRRRVVNIRARTAERAMIWTDEPFAHAWRRLLEEPYVKIASFQEARDLLMDLRYL